MVIGWHIRYLDRSDRAWKARNLYLVTSTLDPVTKAAVEFAVETMKDRRFFKYRPRFTEGEWPKDKISAEGLNCFSMAAEYFEDENCNELSMREVAQIVTGSPTAVMVPAGTEEHDIEFMLSEPRPIPVDEISLSVEDQRTLGIFVQDIDKLGREAFMKEGSPATLTSSGDGDPILTTAASDEEITSCATIIRHFLMEREPANLKKSAGVYSTALGDHPFGMWVAAAERAFDAKLNQPPHFCPYAPPSGLTFTLKRLIDVFLYTQILHQQDKTRQRQYEECLAEVGGRKAVLAWLFISELRNCGLQISNIGRVIAGWFRRYCEHHGITPDVLRSLQADHQGIGAGEKDADRKARLFKEKAEGLAMDLWNEHGSPPGGHTQFIAEAEVILRKATEPQK